MYAHRTIQKLGSSGQAGAAVAGTPELMDMIAEHLSTKDLVRLQQVSKQFCAFVRSSKPVGRMLFVFDHPSNKLQPQVIAHQNLILRRALVSNECFASRLRQKLSRNGQSIAPEKLQDVQYLKLFKFEDIRGIWAIDELEILGEGLNQYVELSLIQIDPVAVGHHSTKLIPAGSLLHRMRLMDPPTRIQIYLQLQVTSARQVAVDYWIDVHGSQSIGSILFAMNARIEVWRSLFEV